MSRHVSHLGSVSIPPKAASSARTAHRMGGGLARQSSGTRARAAKSLPVAAEQSLTRTGRVASARTAGHWVFEQWRRYAYGFASQPWPLWWVACGSGFLETLVFLVVVAGVSV